MRRYGIASIAVAIAGIISFFTFEEASADHGNETIDLLECQAFQYVLSANDQLYMCITNVVELEHASTSDDLGTAGVFLLLEEASSTVEIATLPRLGVGIAAIYFAGDDISAPEFASDSVDAYLAQNPSFFISPVESEHIDIEFNESSDYVDTQDLLSLIIPQMMFRLEFLDENISLGTLIDSTGITNQGRIYIDESFQQILILAASAFAVPSVDLIATFDPPDIPAILEAIQEQGKSTYFATGFMSFGKLIGLGFTGSVIVINLIIFLILVWLVRKFKEKMNHSVVYYATIPALFIDAYIGAFTFAIPILYVNMLFILGSGMFLTRRIPG